MHVQIVRLVLKEVATKIASLSMQMLNDIRDSIRTYWGIILISILAAVIVQEKINKK
jgi:hypothetical protein